MMYILKIFFFLLVVSCSSKDVKIITENETETDKKIFNKGLDLIKDKKYKESIIEFKKITDEFPYSDFSAQSQIYNAYLNFELNKLDETIIILNEYIIMNPKGKFTEYAEYLIAMCFYVQISDPTRDGKFTKTAIQKFKKLIKKYPNSKYAKDSKPKLEYLRNYVAKKEFEIGMYYLKNNAPSPAIKRFSLVIEDYQGTTIIPQTLFRMYEAFLILKLKDNADKTYAILKFNFPNSKWINEIKKHNKNINPKNSFFGSIVSKVKSIF